MSRRYKYFGPMFSKVSLKEPNTHPLFRFLQSESRHQAQWNFHKWLIDGNGNLVGSWSHQHDIKAIQQAIQQVIPTAS